MFEIVTRVSKQRVEDLLVTAFEGGINYWASIVRYNAPNVKYDVMSGDDKPMYCLVPLTKGCSVVLTDVVDPEETWTLDLDALQRGLITMAADPKHAKHWADLCNESYDAQTADVFVQLCLFGEIVYG